MVRASGRKAGAARRIFKGSIQPAQGRKLQRAFAKGWGTEAPSDGRMRIPLRGRCSLDVTVHRDTPPFAWRIIALRGRNVRSLAITSMPNVSRIIRHPTRLPIQS